MGVWARSWNLTKMSFGVIKKDKEMLAFPAIAAFFSVLFTVALLVPTTILPMMHKNLKYGPVQILADLAIYFALAFFATFSNVCVVYTTKTRLEGGDATFMQSVMFAMSRIHLILMWSAVSATVGLFFRALDLAAERAGLIGKILISILRALLAAAWSIITIFVIPAMVYEGLGPFDAIKKSVDTLKRTWGESLIRHYGLGLVTFLLILPAFLLFLVVSAMSAALGVFAIVLLGLLFVYILAVFLVMGVANTVYNTALYAYATQGSAPEGFAPEVLTGAFTPKMA